MVNATTPTIPDVTFTSAQLRARVDADEGACAMACDGFVFDTTTGRDFYGPGGPYAALNGRDATRALATMKINVSEEEMKTLGEWRDKFLGKYPVLGRFVRS